MKAKCEECRFWVYDKYLKVEIQGHNKGKCHRFPKEEIKDNTEWCGDFEPKGDVT